MWVNNFFYVLFISNYDFSEYRERISKRRKQRRIEEGLSQGKTLEEIEQKYDSMKFNLTGQSKS